MVINDLLKKGVALMKGLEYANPILESLVILSDLLKVDKVYIYTNGQEKVSPRICQEYLDRVGKRAGGYPLAYLLGKKEFMGLDFYIEEGVLIPRPETEILVEYLIDQVNKKFGGKKIDILDIGSGSGAIALSLGMYCPTSRVYGVDISPRAIKIGNINRDRFDLDNVVFYQGDLFGAVENKLPGKRFDIIVSNPPYIKRDDLAGLQREVRDFEPGLALDGGGDGLDYYRKISKRSKEYLKTRGLLVYEIGYNQAEDVRGILLREGFSHISLLKDFQGHDRVVSGILE